jgi:predicted DNA-binding protein (UPF0251 family)
MTNDQSVDREQAIVPEGQNPQEVAPDITPETRELVTQRMPNETAEVQQETMELFETIRLKAQSEMQKAQQEAERASELTREAYLDAVRNVRTEVENMNVFDPDRIEYTIKLMQMDAENNWENMVKQFNEMGERLNDAAQAAWAALTSPKTYTEKEERTIDESKRLD